MVRVVEQNGTGREIPAMFHGTGACHNVFTIFLKFLALGTSLVPSHRLNFGTGVCLGLVVQFEGI